MSKFLTIESARVMRVPVGPSPDDPDEERWMTIGVRVDIADGTHWFWSYTHKSWCHTQPGTPITNRSGSPVMVDGEPQYNKDVKTSFKPSRTSKRDGDEELLHQWKGRERMTAFAGDLIFARSEAEVLALENPFGSRDDKTWFPPAKAA